MEFPKTYKLFKKVATPAGTEPATNGLEVVTPCGIPLHSPHGVGALTRGANILNGEGAFICGVFTAMQSAYSLAAFSLSSSACLPEARIY
jgi:hypothetical protein